MTNLEGRVIRRRKALDPPAGVRDDLQLLAELADRLGRAQASAATPRRCSTSSRRASAGGVADYAGITYRRIDAEQGVFWPCPTADHPGTPRLFADRFATPDGRARFLPGRARRRARAARRRLPLRAHHRPGAWPSTSRAPRPGGPAACSWSRPTRAPSCTPTWPARSASAPDDVVELATRRGRARFHALRHRRHPAGRRLRAVPLGRRLQRQRAHRPRAGPDQPDARLQGLRGRRRPGRRPDGAHRAARAGHPAAAARPRNSRPPPHRTPRPGGGPPA